MSREIGCTAVYPTLAVPDVSKACDWYVQNLGFSLRFLWGDPAEHGAVLLGDACIHFWEAEAQQTQNWLYFDVTSLDAIYDLACANGVQITKPPEIYPWGMREFNMLDLNGYQPRFGQFHHDTLG